MGRDAEGFVLGVDGGNSKTAVAVATLEGEVVASIGGDPTHIYGGDTAKAIADLVTLTATALRAAGTTVAHLRSAVFSLAGADWPEDFELLETELTAGLGLPRPPLVVNDAIGGMRSGTADGAGIAVVCGTFNAVGARNRDGRTFHCGFWPDRTGGFDLGTEALEAVYRAGLDLGPPTRLTAAALGLFGADDALALMHAFTRREGAIPPWDVQRLAPLLFDCAEAGDEVARAIVLRAGGWLGEEARVSAARVGLPIEGTPVVLTGGVFRHPSSLLVDAVMARLPGAVPVRPEAPPLVGALLLAYDQVGVVVPTGRLVAGLDAGSDAPPPGPASAHVPEPAHQGAPHG